MSNLSSTMLQCLTLGKRRYWHETEIYKGSTFGARPRSDSTTTLSHVTDDDNKVDDDDACVIVTTFI